MTHTKRENELIAEIGPAKPYRHLIRTWYRDADVTGPAEYVTLIPHTHDGAFLHTFDEHQQYRHRENLTASVYETLLRTFTRPDLPYREVTSDGVLVIEAAL